MARIREEMDRELIECSVETFIQHYLPYQPEAGKVEALLNEAKYGLDCTAVIPASNTENGDTATRAAARTNGAPGPFPKCSSYQGSRSVEDAIGLAGPHRVGSFSVNETPTYNYFKRIMDSVANGTVAGRSRNGFQYHSCPKAVVQSEIHGFDSRIDGCIISGTCVSPNVDLDLKASAIAVAFTCVFEPSQKHESDINLQAVSANVQIMNDDVRRMFTYGVTIIGENVRLWYHGRSHSAVSEPFNFVKNPQVFIEAMLAFLFASEVELGYDDEITRSLDNRLVFAMEDGEGNPIYYRSVRILSEDISSRIRGRMSRVWEVEQVANSDGSGEVLSRGVLKDIWLDNDALTERQVQESIYRAIEKRKATIGSYQCIQRMTRTPRNEIVELVENGRYKEFFLTIVADFEGRFTKAMASGARRKRGLLVPELQHPKPSTKPDNVLGTRQEFKSKRQYRVVFAELCVTVGSMEVLGQVIDVLMQTLTALRLLYFAGWVHRDISSGNVMAYNTSAHGGPVEWQAKLCDLEYAREYSLNHPEVLKTGTPYFMPHEILFGQPLLPDNLNNTVVRIRSNDPDDEDDSRIVAAQQAAATKRKFHEPELTVVPNFQHDLECIWWLTVHTVTARVAHPPSQRFALDIFRRMTELSNHRAVFLRERIQEDLAICLHPDLTSISASLEILRSHLLHYYREGNRKRLVGDTEHDLESYADIHNAFFISFKAMRKLPDKVLGFPLIAEDDGVDRPPPLQPRKRARSAQNDNGEDMEEDCKAPRGYSEVKQVKKPRVTESSITKIPPK